jgi:putative transposase
MSEHLPSGNKKAKSRRSKLLRDSEDTTYSHTQLVLNLFGQQSSTPELVPAHNNQTLTDKSPLLLPSTPTPKLSVKSEEGLISSGKSFKPYWNESCKELSGVLWWHTKIGLPDSDLTTFDGCVSNTGVKSWYSTKQHSVPNAKWLRTSSPFSTALAQDSTDCESINLRCHKIQIYPSPELNRVWKQWSAACRYVYNQAIAYLHKNGRIGKLKLRDTVMQSALPQWVKDTPCHIRQNAIFDAHRAYRASKDCKFRSCRASSQTIKFNDCNYSNGTWYPKITKGLTFLASEPIPQKCALATQLVKCKGKWFAVFPEPALLADNQSYKVIALDPGVRTFLTGFDGSKFLEFGAGDMGRITRLCQHLDKLWSRIAKCQNKRQRQKMRSAAGRMRTKIQDLVNEVHKQVACYLTQNYRIIFLPTFETSQMVQKAKRKIQSKTARAMLSWAHYRFKVFLKQAAIRRGCTVIDVTEEYTSKTCTRCGHVHKKLGGCKKFKCPNCGHELDRDFNGAFGILLKALSDTTCAISDDGVAIVALRDNISCSAA